MTIVCDRDIVGCEAHWLRYAHRIPHPSRILWIILSVLLLARTAAEECPVGIILGLSGAGSIYSADALLAARLAVAEINAAGGLLGRHPIRLIEVDDQCKAEVASQAAKTLVQAERVRCVIGAWSSASAMAIKPVCAEARVLHLAALSNAEDLTRLDPSPFTFSLVPNTYMNAKAVSQVLARLAREKGWRSYATIASDYAFGKSMQGNVAEQLRRLAPGLELRAERWVRLGETEWAPHMAALAASKPDFVFNAIAADDQVRWFAAARAAGFLARFPSPGAAVSVSELLAQRDSLPRGTLAIARAPFFAHPDQPMMRHLVDTWKATHGGAPPSDWAVMHYDAVMALRQGAERAGSIAADAIRSALAGQAVDTCRGRLAFRAIDNQLACPVYLGTIADDPAYPFPIYHDLQIIPGADCMRPEAEIAAARQAGP